MSRLFRLASLVAIAAAIFHGLSAAFPSVARLEYEPTYPTWRHIVFIGINLALAGLFRVRPRWFVWAYGALTIQILASHGWGAVRLWRLAGYIDWISVAVSVGAPLLLVALVADRRARIGFETAAKRE